MSTTPTADHYLQLDALARRLLRRHQISERQRLIAEIVLDYSFRIGRDFAIIPAQRVFIALTGISKGNVSETLKSLDLQNIVQVDLRDVPRYAFNIDVATWRRVDCRLRTAAHLQFADRVEAWLFNLSQINPAQLELLESPFDLTAAMATDAREEVLQHFLANTPAPQPASLTKPVANESDRQPSLTASRDGGDGTSGLTGPRFQTPSGPIDTSAGPDANFDITDPAAVARRIFETFPRDEDSPPEFPNREHQVPSSGTPHLMHLDGSNSSHLDGTEWAVPESGTRTFPPARETVPSRGGSGASSSRRPVERENELLDEIRNLGALIAKDGRDYGGFWRTKIREDRHSMVDAVAELRLRLANSRLKTLKNRGGYLRDRYNRFHAEALAAT